MIHIQDYHIHVYFKDFQTFFFFNFSKPDPNNPSPRTGPEGFLVTHYDCEENEQKTLHKYAINQITQCESKAQSNSKQQM